MPLSSALDSLQFENHYTCCYLIVSHWILVEAEWYEVTEEQPKDALKYGGP